MKVSEYEVFEGSAATTKLLGVNESNVVVLVPNSSTQNSGGGLSRNYISQVLLDMPEYFFSFEGITESTTEVINLSAFNSDNAAINKTALLDSTITNLPDSKFVKGSTNSYIFSAPFEFPPNPYFASTDCWINLPTGSGKGQILACGDTQGQMLGIGSGTFETAGNRLIFLSQYVGWQDCNVNLTAGTHHIGFSSDNGTVKVFLNGRRCIQFTLYSNQPENKFHVGGTGSRAFTEWVTAPAFYSCPLADSRFFAHYKAGQLQP